MEVPVKIVPLTENAEWSWVYERARPIRTEDTTGFVAYRGDRLVAAIVFDSWTANSCVAHIAIDEPFVLRHGFIETGCDFVFNHANRGVIVGLVPANNHKALKFDKHIGFKEICRVKDGYKVGVDYIILEMRQETCRWLAPRNTIAA